MRDNEERNHRKYAMFTTGGSLGMVETQEAQRETGSLTLSKRRPI